MSRSLWLHLGWLYLAASLFFSANAHAQVVYGTVVIDGTTTAIANAQVDMTAADGSVVASAMTNLHGAFFLVARTGGSYTLRVTHVGYTPVSVEQVTIEDDQLLEVTLRAAQATIPLEPIEVVVRRPSTGVHGFRARMAENSAFGRFVSRAEIDSRPASMPTEFLRMIPGVRLIPVREETAATRGHRITLRAGTCSPTIYIDGLRVPDHQTDAIDDMLSADMLEGVEVYTTVTPPGLESVPGPDRCGSVAFWTRMHEGGKPWDGLRFASALGVFIAGLLLAATIQ